MNLVKTLLTFLLVFSHSLNLWAGPSSESPKTLVMNLGTIASDTQVSYTEVPLENHEQLTRFLNNPKALNSDVLLSTDSVETYAAVAESIKSQKRKTDRLFRFIPIGKLVSAQEKMASGWAEYKKNVSETVKYDKFGLSIVVITTAYDSFIWIHSASLDVYQKSAMVMLNIVFAAAFALDRDMWAKMTIPLRHKVINAIDRVAGKSTDLKSQMTLKRVVAAQFLANLAFSTGFQLLRSSIISMHDLSTAVMSSHFWAMSLTIAGLTTLSSFAWSELLAAADNEKNPVAKNALKRIADVRNLLMSQVASMGMVLQPNVYGHSPVVAIVVSGALGILALVESNQVIRLLEKNPLMRQMFRQQRKVETLINEVTLYKDGGYCAQMF